MSSPALHCLFLVFLVTLTAPSVIGDDTPTAYDILEKYDFPVGLLPEGVTGYELDESTGDFKVYLDGTCSFSVEGYDLRYRSPITGVIRKDKITNLKGISVKVLILWFNIGKVTRSGDELDFTVGIASASFTVDNFQECPRCGCGFDCVDGQKKNGTTKLALRRRFMPSLLRWE
ncbi:hypothetical protein NMG60_11035039 [Bertholletia excelsa]